MTDKIMSSKQTDAEPDANATSIEDLLNKIEELQLANAAKDAELVKKDAELVKKDGELVKKEAELVEKNMRIEDLKTMIRTKGYVQYLSQRCTIQHLQSRFTSLCC